MRGPISQQKAPMRAPQCSLLETNAENFLLAKRFKRCKALKVLQITKQMGSEEALIKEDKALTVNNKQTVAGIWSTTSRVCESPQDRSQSLEEV